MPEKSCLSETRWKNLKWKAWGDVQQRAGFSSPQRCDRCCGRSFEGRFWHFLKGTDGYVLFDVAQHVRLFSNSGRSGYWVMSLWQRRAYPGISQEHRAEQIDSYWLTSEHTHFLIYMYQSTLYRIIPSNPQKLIFKSKKVKQCNLSGFKKDSQWRWYNPATTQDSDSWSVTTCSD